MHAIGSMLRRLTGGDEARGRLTGGDPTSPHLTGSRPAITTGAAGAAGTRTVPELVESKAMRRAPSKEGPRSISAVGLSSEEGLPSPSAAAAGLRSCLFCHPMPTLKIDRERVL